MKTLALSCNHCGAPLQVPESANYATCGHCGSRLKIEQTESSYSTTVLNNIDRRTEEIQESLEDIKLQNELERIDREWEREEDSYTEYDKHGRPYKPGGIGAIIGIGIAVVGGFIFLKFATGIANTATSFGGPFSGGARLVPLFGLIFIIVAVLGGLSSLAKGNRLNDSRRRYHSRRESLLHKMQDRTRKRRRRHR